MRRLRWLVFGPVALLAVFAPAVSAQDYMVWTCIAGAQWQMQQPIADYEAGLFPTWADCEAWRDGPPAEGWEWSYGASVTTTSSSAAPTTTSPDLVPTTSSDTTEQTTTSTTEPAPTTTQTTTTTSPPAPTPPPSPETSALPQSTSTEPEPLVETTAPQAATTVAPTTSQAATSVPALAPSSVPVASESSQAPNTTPSTFVTPGPLVEAPTAEAPDNVKEAFEAQVNIFSGEHDDYVPAGSTITVAQRRTIVAATTILMTLPTPTASRRRI